MVHTVQVLLIKVLTMFNTEPSTEITCGCKELLRQVIHDKGKYVSLTCIKYGVECLALTSVNRFNFGDFNVTAPFNITCEMWRGW